MTEIEPSKTLKPLSTKAAGEWVKDQQQSTEKNAVSLYLFLAQDGLAKIGKTFKTYCRDAFAIDERTGQYWRSQVIATMAVKGESDTNMLFHWNQGWVRNDFKLIPARYATELAKLPPGRAAEVWIEFGTTRSEAIGSENSNVEALRKIANRPNAVLHAEIVAEGDPYAEPDAMVANRTETVSGSRDQNEANTVYPGPWCECGEPVLPDSKFCSDCISDAVSPDPLPEDDPIGFADGDDPTWYKPVAPPRPEIPTHEDVSSRQPETDDETDDALTPEAEIISQPAANLPPMRSIAVLTVCSAVKTGRYPEVYTLRLTDGNGHEQTAVLTQRVLDLAPVKEL